MIFSIHFLKSKNNQMIFDFKSEKQLDDFFN